jgi:hypothetical protein
MIRILIQTTLPEWDSFEASLEDANVCQDNISTRHGNQLRGASQQGSTNIHTMTGRVSSNFYSELGGSLAGAGRNFGTNSGHLISTGSYWPQLEGNVNMAPLPTMRLKQGRGEFDLDNR